MYCIDMWNESLRAFVGQKQIFFFFFLIFFATFGGVSEAPGKQNFFFNINTFGGVSDTPVKVVPNAGKNCKRREFLHSDGALKRRENIAKAPGKTVNAGNAYIRTALWKRRENIDKAPGKTFPDTCISGI